MCVRGRGKREGTIQRDLISIITLIRLVPAIMNTLQKRVMKLTLSVSLLLFDRPGTMLGIPVVCSWNLSAGASPQEELDLLSNLLAKKIKEKYQSNREGTTEETTTKDANVASLSLS